MIGLCCPLNSTTVNIDIVQQECQAVCVWQLVRMGVFWDGAAVAAALLLLSAYSSGAVCVALQRLSLLVTQ
jgi:hypothetical protein